MSDIYRELEKLRDAWLARAKPLSFIASPNATSKGMALRECAADLTTLLEAKDE